MSRRNKPIGRIEVVTSTVFWARLIWGWRVWGATVGSARATGGREELGLLLEMVDGPTQMGLLGWGMFWRRIGSQYSDKSILRPRLGRGGSHVVWCLYIANRFSPRCFHLIQDQSLVLTGEISKQQKIKSTDVRQLTGWIRTRSGCGSQRESICLRLLSSLASSKMESCSSFSTST